MRLRGMFPLLCSLITALLLLGQSVMAAGPGVITPEEGRELMRRIRNLVILDVRNPSEYVTKHYSGALNIPVNELETRLSEVPSGRPVLVHCAKGRRSARGYAILKEKRPDLTELYSINGEPLFE